MLVFPHMCESTVFVEEKERTQEVMRDVARILIEGRDAICISVIGERVVLKNVKLKEANMLSHGIVFTRD